MLDKKVPPLIVAVIAAVGIWGLSIVLPKASVPVWLSVGSALLLSISGGVICLVGIVEFRRAETTVDPRYPESTSALVTSGVYAITRNPMYVGFALLLTAWATYLVSPWSLIIVVGFVAYLDRFQIQPEERSLAELFGQQFLDYQAKVRRWL